MTTTSSEAVGARVRVLHLEANAQDATLIHDALASTGVACEIEWVQTRRDFEAALGRGSYDLVLSADSLPSLDGLSALQMARHQQPETPFCFVSGPLAEDPAIESLVPEMMTDAQRERLVRLVSVARRAYRQSHAANESEQAARKIREQAALLNQAPDAIFVRDLEQRITYWNQGAERVYGWSAAESLGRPPWDLFIRPCAWLDDEAWRRVFETGDWTGELTHRTKAGNEITVVSRHSLLRDPLGYPMAVLTINTDVTERKQLEAQVLRAQRVENIGALAGGIAHDLNNILAPVLMAADLLLEQFPEGPVRQTLATIRQSAVRGSALVNQILQFARGTKGEPVVLQLWHLVKDFSTLIRDTFPRSIHIETQVADDLQLVMVDATQLHQVLLNLCVNARDAMPAGGELRIEASNIVLDRKVFPGHSHPVSGQYVILRVADTGVGIPEPLLDKLFQPFFTTKVQGKGTGLGLSTVASIVRSHRGFIEVASQLGQGTTFEIYLPAATEAKSPEPAPSTAGAPIGHGEHILLVDDELAVLAMTREILQANHYQVTTARNGEDALRFFREHAGDIDAIVTDLMMPGLDGPSLVRAVKQIAPEARIVCISGLASEEKLAELDRAAVRGLVRKPYSAYDFLVTLRAALN